MDTSRLVCLLRSKWSLEAAARQLAAIHSDSTFHAAPTDHRLSAQQRFVCHPLSEHLVLVCACDYGDRYEYVDASEAAAIGLTPKQALEVAWRNTLELTAQQADGQVRFEKMPEFGWIPSIAGTDECVALLADGAAIRSLPVSGRHLAFAPNSRGFWITGTENLSGVAMLSAIVLNEYENAEGKPLTPIPVALGDDGKWHSWLPPTTHPGYWQVRALHNRFLHEIYEEQRELLRGGDGEHADKAFVARHFIHAYGQPENEITFTSSVWADVETLLPKTDLIELKPLLNRSAMAADDRVEPQFGPTISIAWDRLAEAAGDRLRAQGTYPERYLVPSFSEGPLLEQLRRFQIQSPYELFPEFSPPMPNGSRPQGQAGYPPRQASNGSKTLAVIVAIAAVTMALMCSAGIALFVAFRLLLPATSGQRPVAATPWGNQGPTNRSTPQNQANVEGVVQPPHRDRELAPLPAFDELNTPASPIPALAPENREIVSAREDSGLQIGFQDEAPEGAWLVGARAVSGNDWGGVLRSLQPIYQREEQYLLGQSIGLPGGRKQTQLLARPDYAVSAVRFQRGLVVNAFQFTYSRVVDAHFDLTDSYNSDWFGLADGREVQSISTGGFPIVGLAGRYDGGCFSEIALLRPKREASDQKTAELEWTPIGEFAELADTGSELSAFIVDSREVAGDAERGAADLARSEASDGSWLVGVRATTGVDWGGVLCALQPIYQSGNRYQVGERVGAPGGERQVQVLAKPGYAVARIESQRGLVVNAIKITFARVADSHFDMTDTYDSSWLGYADGRAVETQSSGGAPALGFAYASDGRCFAELRLISARLQREAAALEANESELVLP